MMPALRQPFGGLLFGKVARMEYLRVAADSLTIAPVRKDVPLSDLIGNIHVIDVR